ncbi:hypothetical protein U9M48_042401 [Paspalum notatum var. saurae]|uniref:Uncharacterized protein n=1 Tax=Paspalum notatum var. saurae TaxID=547442 RepID=A0AAQ3UV80_PASNO
MLLKWWPSVISLAAVAHRTADSLSPGLACASPRAAGVCCDRSGRRGALLREEKTGFGFWKLYVALFRDPFLRNRKLQSIVKHFKNSRAFKFLLHTQCESLQECVVLALADHDDISTVYRTSQKWYYNNKQPKYTGVKNLLHMPEQKLLSSHVKKQRTCSALFLMKSRSIEHVCYTHMESPNVQGLLCQDLPELTLCFVEVPIELVQLRHHQSPLHLAGFGVTQPLRVPQRLPPVRAPHLGVQQALERVHVAGVAAQNRRILPHLLILLHRLQLLQHILLILLLLDLFLLVALFGFQLLQHILLTLLLYYYFLVLYLFLLAALFGFLLLLILPFDFLLLMGGRRSAGAGGERADAGEGEEACGKHENEGARGGGDGGDDARGRGLEGGEGGDSGEARRQAVEQGGSGGAPAADREEGCGGRRWGGGGQEEAHCLSSRVQLYLFKYNTYTPHDTYIITSAHTLHPHTANTFKPKIAFSKRSRGPSMAMAGSVVGALQLQCVRGCVGDAHIVFFLRLHV